MNIHRLGKAAVYHFRRIPFRVAVLALGAALTVWSLATSPADALNNRQQLLTGGTSLVCAAPCLAWSAPGLQNVLGNDFPTASHGEQATQIRMTGGGVLKKLFVRLTTQATPSAGSFTVMVRINGADTALTCTLLAEGQCHTGATSITIANGARLSVKIAHNFTGAGNLAFTYTMLLD